MEYQGLLNDLILATCILSLVFVVVFLLRRKPLPYYLYIGCYAILAYTLFIKYLYFSNEIINYPNLFKSASSIQYLIAPASYFFVLKALQPARKFRNWDILHLFPFLLHSIELIPYYLTSSEYKVSTIKATYHDFGALWNMKDGLLFTYREQLFIKEGLGLIYLLFQWKLIFGHIKKWDALLKQQNKTLLRWIQFDTLIKSLLTISLFVSMFLALKIIFISILPSILVLSGLLLGFSFILLYPSILSGIQPVIFDYNQPPLSDPTTENNSKIASSGLHNDSQLDFLPEVEEYFHYKSTDSNKELFFLLEQHMQTTLPYLDFELSRTQLAENINTSPRRMSEVIKGEAGLSFSDYVNTYRIHYLESMLRTYPQWKSYTIEAMAMKAGFYSRAAFYNALKRLKNEVPTDLIRRNS